MSSLEPGLRGKREHLALESPRETRDATPAPATPPQNASTISRDTTSASFADLRQHIAKRGAPFTGRVRVDSSASASKPLEPSGAGGSPMKRVASTPSLQARASTPAPGSQGMRDMFFVRQDNINFNLRRRNLTLINPGDPVTHGNAAAVQIGSGTRHGEEEHDESSSEEGDESSSEEGDES